MKYGKLERLIKTQNWSELEQAWLETVETPDADTAELLTLLDSLIGAKQTPLASTLAWAWLSSVKETRTPHDALQLGRALLLRLPDGEELREDILTLYRATHSDKPDLDGWIDRSGMRSGKSVRRALRFLEVGLRLSPGMYLTHRIENEAAQIVQLDVEADVVVIKTPRRTNTFDVAHLIEEYNLASENDFRVLSQFRQDRIVELLDSDPLALTIGILRCHGDRMDRDALKLLLVPKYLPAEKWSDWWGRIRDGVKRSRNLRLEGRSPMFLVYDEVGQTLESEVWGRFGEAQTPREWLELLEGYLRDVKQQKMEPNAEFIGRVQTSLVERIERFTRHSEPTHALATALVLERLAMDGLPISADAHGVAVRMLTEAADPVATIANLPDARLWPLAVRSVEQAFPEKWPAIYAELILYCPAGQCDPLAKGVEQAGKAELLHSVVERATADPGQYTDAMMWVWKGPGVKAELPIPPPLELLSIVLALVGPARTSGERTGGAAVTEMRAKVRAGLSAKSYERFKQCLEGLDMAMAQTVRRQVERASGLGPRAQDDMTRILLDAFPQIYVKPKVTMWEDDSVLYFTQVGYDTRQAEIDELVNVKMRENAKAIGEAAAHGDLSENSEYKFALEERDLLRARLAQYNREISLARVIEPHDVPTDHVSIGQRVTLKPLTGGEPVMMTILGVNDGDIAKRVFSYRTPLAASVLGKKVGDTAAVAFDGQEAQYQIEQIDCAIPPSR
jgi:transcription elongation factor GreA